LDPRKKPARHSANGDLLPEALESRYVPSVSLGTGFAGLGYADTQGYVPADVHAFLRPPEGRQRPRGPRPQAGQTDFVPVL
jgi:hypothetical protein